ncbi:methionyl-tRNA synthetase, mitochondrial isoform X1 [Halictus rubicundus]|uniref:methionyl-tRNA synthetase, mitochondrial isoform X1 n=1 Tax=Halictus rubicundus TaxID=77578 RepID=UPI004035D558
MAIPLRNLVWLSSLSTFRKRICVNISSGNKRFIMTSSRRLEKVLEDLQKNPYFDKYAEKIAKFQKTSPDEFLQRIENEEKKLQEKKVSVRWARSPSRQYLRTFSLFETKAQPLWIHIRKNHFCNDAARNVYITTPIFYVNAGPHVGHLYTAVLADSIARFNSMLGHSVVLCTGTDEHGTKVEKAANKAATPTSLYCTDISQQFQRMCDTFDVKYSRFIRTTEQQHVAAVHHFWNRLDEKGYVYMDKYSGWYSVSDEAFISDTDLIEQKDKVGNVVRLTADSGNSVEWTEECTYKFRLTSFQDDLRYWLKNENTVQPAIYHKILLNWIDEGLQDLSISRPIGRVPWAIPTPSDKTHTVYVWLDALVNYLTSIGYPDSSFQQFWPATVQVVGKDILKFHGVYWPAFLMAVGLEPPKRLLCHGHWTVDDQKMSKSKGNVISPFDAMLKFTAEGLRYFLLRQAVPHSDANYNARKIQNIVNAELANTFGNLLNRCLGKQINPRRVIPNPSSYVETLRSDVALENIKLLEEIGSSAKQYYEEHHLHHVVDAVMSMLHASNRMFDEHQPWRLCKDSSENSVKELEAVLSLSLESVRVAALILYPIIPTSSSNLLDSLEVPVARRTWQDTKPLHLTNCFDSGQRRTVPQDVFLFKRILKN